MFSRDQIDQVRSAVDIVETIREYVPSLKASGRSVKGLCPFHSERTPSFHVHPDKGLFKCFGCGESGDVIGFIVKMEQLGFSEALEMLADRAGIQLRREKTIEKREPEGHREKLFRVLDAARTIYEEWLWDEKLGANARAYLEERAIRPETIEAFHLGVAVGGGQSAFELLVKKGFPIELCQSAGLVTRSQAGRYYDPMFGRLLFPIFDNFGHTIGFGGRVLPKKKGLLETEGEADEGPKYLNSPETPVFSKGKSLYGLHQAKKNILASRSVVILEGYMDVVGVHQGGVTNAVATLGTAFTRDHAKALKRYADEIVAFFDPDAAGEKAALRSLEPMVAEELFPRVVVTTETGDPDEIIEQKGKDFFDALLKEAPDFLDYMLNLTKASPQMPLPEKSKAAMEILAVIAVSPNEILKSEWIGRLADRLGLRRESLIDQMKRKGAALAQQQAPKPVVKNILPPRTISSAEEELIQLVLTAPETGNDLDLDESDLPEERQKRVFREIRSQLANGKLSVPGLLEAIPQEDRDWFMRLSLEERQFDEPLERRSQLIRGIRLKRDKRRLQDLSRRLAQGIATAEEQEQYKELLRRVKGSEREPFSEITNEGKVTI